MPLSPTQRQRVRQRAGGCCEYCRTSEDARLSDFHIDHIIAVKHGGTDDDDNLCLACYKCNAYKGSNVAAIDPITNNATKLYHPRMQLWHEHFSIQPEGTVTGLTPEGRATVAVLRINDAPRIYTRYLSMQVGEYPCEPSP